MLLIISPVNDIYTSILPFEKIKRSAVAKQNSAVNETAAEAEPIEYPLLYKGLLIINQ